jgi:hypothetical protein
MLGIAFRSLGDVDPLVFQPVVGRNAPSLRTAPATLRAGVAALGGLFFPIRRAAINASCGIDTEPYSRIFAFPFFCFSSSFRFRAPDHPELVEGRRSISR